MHAGDNKPSGPFKYSYKVIDPLNSVFLVSIRKYSGV
jgi:hypothetical protein